MGEHSDWAAGYRRTHPEISRGHCLVAGTDQGLHAEARPIADALEIESVLPHGEEMGPARIQATVAALTDAAAGADFFSYAAGVAAEAIERFQVGGLRMRVDSDLPVRKGLSSSAAVCVLVARAYSKAYGLGLDVATEMDLAYAGERRTGSECGRMDQVCAYGRQVTSLVFDGEGLQVDVVEPGAEFHFLIVDLRRGKDTRRILSDLNACYPNTQGAVARRVREGLGQANIRLVAEGRRAIETGDVVGLGACLDEAQTLFDEAVAPASQELRSPRLHEILDHPAVSELAHGAKGIGSQGDGSVQVLAHDVEAREELARRLETEEGVHCLRLSLGSGRDEGEGLG
ncbi:MAG: GHMP kinase [bacterium]|nr:GHMP kinase [bacterium]